jgi:hypothetical protein
MRFHIHFPSAKAHTFGLQPQALFNGGIAAQFDLATRSQNPLPGQAETVAKNRRNLPRRAGNSRSPCHAAVG